MQNIRGEGHFTKGAVMKCKCGKEVNPDNAGLSAVVVKDHSGNVKRVICRACVSDRKGPRVYGKATAFETERICAECGLSFMTQTPNKKYAVSSLEFWIWIL